MLKKKKFPLIHKSLKMTCCFNTFVISSTGKLSSVKIKMKLIGVSHEAHQEHARVTPPKIM